jgi:undecaprenyl-diphosphatase
MDYFLGNILDWDKNLFLTLNGQHSSFFDIFMWMFSTKDIWIPAFICLIYVILKDKKRETLFIVIGIILTIIISDQISSSIIKPLVERLRPSHEPLLNGLVHIVNGYKAGEFGFVSSHAANSFAFALFTSLVFRYKPYTFVIFIWALVNSYSRIYLGLHYPLDIICGGVVGIISALMVYYLYFYLRNIFTGFIYNSFSKVGLTSSGFSFKGLWLIILFIVITIFFITIFSFETVNLFH